MTKPKRTLRASEIVNDIRAGMTDAKLMAKYDLSAKGLASVFKKLVDVKAVKPEEVYGRFPSREDTINVENLRGLPRSYLAFPLSICESANPKATGIVRDINERGVQVSGLECHVNETKEFLVRADEFEDMSPFAFKAACRWAKKGTDQADWLAGFEITDISEQALKEVRKIAQAMAFSD
ncbi:MAG: hypothetical protein AB1664_19645 [Thermodesulfobacteriota bacterium]